MVSQYPAERQRMRKEQFLEARAAERLSASTPETPGFLAPGFPIEVAPAAAPAASRLPYLTRFAGPFGLGFGLGLALGTYIFGDPFGDPAITPQPGEEGLDGWWAPGWTWDPCAGATQPGTGSIRYNESGRKSVAGCVTTDNMPGTTYATPQEVYEDRATNGLNAYLGVDWVRAGAANDVVQGEWHIVGFPDPYPDPGPWYHPVLNPPPGETSPGYAVPLAPSHTEFPELFPILQPIVPPTPQKWADAVPDPALQPNWDLSVGGVVTVPLPSIRVIGVTPDPAVDIVVQPQVITPSPDGGVDVVPSTDVPGTTGPGTPGGTGHPEPPPRGTKEKMVHVGSVGGRFWLAVNAATEAYDFLDSMWKGIPKEKRSRPRRRDGRVTPDTMLSDIWENFDEWDARSAIAAYISNQVEDFIFGSLGRGAASASAGVGVSTGLGSALSRAREWAEKAPEENRDGDPTNDIDLGLPIPVLTYDRETKEWDIDFGG